jgi:hypothetical protein
MHLTVPLAMPVRVTNCDNIDQVILHTVGYVTCIPCAIETKERKGKNGKKRKKGKVSEAN